MFHLAKRWFALALPVTLFGCVDSSGREEVAAAQSCMMCHNGSQTDNYAGPGIENPHPFPAAPFLKCTDCHGGNPLGGDKDGSHVPPPPEIGNREFQDNDAFAYFNRLTLSGMDKLNDYTVNGVTYTALEYLQFVNPGDLRVVSRGESCGQCHQGHAQCVNGSVLATETGIFSGAMYGIGVDNQGGVTHYEDTAADLAFRAVADNNFVHDPSVVGPVGSLLEYPVFSVQGQQGGTNIFQNPLYDAAGLSDDVEADGQVVHGSPLANLYHEQIAFTCGDCHLGSRGANNRYGDFRSSGCTACHMQYSLDGRSRSLDPNVEKLEPADPDNIDDPEQAHVRAHRINGVARTLANGVQMQGIDDYACAGCHQGSNRTVMQFWGIRLDQNQDLHNDVQYPANPDSFTTTQNDPRLFDPVVNNNTFNGRNHRQYILEEDYDGDGKDDTPADVHYEAGMGCIDCHGSFDLHGGDVNNPGTAKVLSRMEQAVAIRCESCHGGIDAYAQTAAGTRYNGQPAVMAVDGKGNPLRHVILEGDGNFYLYSRLTGARHFVPQTVDTIVNNGKRNPFNNQLLYNAKGSYAMGRNDGLASTGTGPQQDTCSGCVTTDFAHSDTMSCVSCHASWTNTCMGCHLEGQYDNNNFSNITGQRIVFEERNADFVYQSPVPFQLGVNAHNEITQVSPNTKMFFQWRDRQGTFSDTFAFSDRQGNGNNGTAQFRALGHNAMMAHSIRGRVTGTQEGPRYCAACHLTDTGLQAFGIANYQTYISDMATGNYGNLNFPQLQTHIGLNTGNRLNSPLWVHMVAGLGSGLFLFDEDGCPVNPLDNNANRKGCDNGAPAANFNPNNAFFNLDRLVDPVTGAPNSSNAHPMLVPNPVPLLRDGASVNPALAGPLGISLVQRLADPVTGIILDAWIDADGVLQGNASTYVK